LESRPRADVHALTRPPSFGNCTLFGQGSYEAHCRCAIRVRVAPSGSYARRVGYSTALPPEVEAFLRTYGTEQIGRRLPRRWRRRRARTSGDCYARASRWCLGEPVIYTEGRALSGGSIERDWTPHAWLTARDGGVIDLARNEESLEATRYFGVAIPALQVVAISRRHQPRRDEPTVTPLPGPVLPELIRSGWTPA
jgi:hypothetical protein